MHADFQELLSLRGGEPVAAEIAEHVSKCPKCALELGRLQQLAQELRQLPQYEPPPRAWLQIQQQLIEQSPRQRRVGWIPVSAAAAAVIAIVCGVLWTTRADRNHAGQPASGVAANSAAAPINGESIGQLVHHSQELEALLQRMPQRPTVERAETSATIDEIQSSIQMLDVQLSNVTKNDTDHDEAQRLWSTRVQLLDSLVYVRYAEVARDARPINTLETGAI
jgi:hypothetical protein